MKVPGRTFLSDFAGSAPAGESGGLTTDSCKHARSRAAPASAHILQNWLVCAGYCCMLWGQITHLDGNVDILEGLPQVLLLDPARNVAEVQGGGGWVDVLVVLAAWLLEPVQS